jgi:hypothetical protein
MVLVSLGRRIGRTKKYNRSEEKRRGAESHGWTRLSNLFQPDASIKDSAWYLSRFLAKKDKEVVERREALWEYNAGEKTSEGNSR